MTSCDTEKLDLASLSVGDASSTLFDHYAIGKEDQKGFFEMSIGDGIHLVDKGEHLNYYNFIANKNVHFANARISESRESKVAISKGKICFIRAYIDNRDAQKLLTSIIREMDQPDSIFLDQRKFDDNEIGMANYLKKTFPLIVKDSIDEFNTKYLIYPIRLIKRDGHHLSIYNFEPLGDNLNFSIRKISKEAYLGHYIDEFAKPEVEEYDSPYKNLFNML